MFESVNVGHMKEYDSTKKYMEWTINNYFSIPHEKNSFIESSSFSFCNEMWYLVIYPNKQDTVDTTGWVGIYLKKKCCTGFRQNITFKIGIKRLGGPKYESYKGTIVTEEILCWGTPKLCKLSNLMNDRSTVAPFGVLNVFCTLQTNKDLFIELSQKTSSVKEKFVAEVSRTPKFNPPTGTDCIMKGGVSTSIGTRFQCITLMQEYENESLEELRLEYYSVHPNTETLRLKLPIQGSSGFLSCASATSFFTPGSFTENRKIARPARQMKKKYTVDNAKKETSLSGVTLKESTFDFKFGRDFEAKPLTGLSTNALNEMTKSFKQFAFGSASRQSQDKNGIVQETEKEFEAIDYDKEKDLSEGLNKLSEDLKELYVNSEDTDIIFKVQDKEFKAHKSILMARSPVFASMFKHDMVEKKDGFVEITDCDSDIFQEFLLYLYSGKNEKLSFDSIFHLYQVSDKYDVQLLKSLCVKFMTQNLCVENFCKILSLAVRFKEHTLLESATKYFVRNIKHIIVTVDWLNFHKENPVEANELHIKALNKILPS